MFITIMTLEGCHTLCLPETINGKYWLRAIYTERKERLLSVEAIDNKWYVISNADAAILDENDQAVDKRIIENQSFYKIKLIKLNQDAYLFTEPSVPESISYMKLSFTSTSIGLTIGRSEDCDIRYNISMVSNVHANLLYSESKFSVTDKTSKNGTFVNNKRVKCEESTELALGDVIYIMGLKIIIGNNFIAINNPNGDVEITGLYLDVYKPLFNSILTGKAPDIKFFTRSPQFRTKIIPCQINVDMPPTKQSTDEMPLALALGSGMTMGLASVTTALFSINNAVANNNVSAAVPSIVMSVSMLLGSVLWPVLTRKYNKGKKEKNEEKRLETYRKYIDKLSDKVDQVMLDQATGFNENYISIEKCFKRIIGKNHLPDSSLWGRLLNDDEFLTLRLGTGTLPMVGEIKVPPERISLVDDKLNDEMRRILDKVIMLPDVPITLSFFEHRIVGITGEEPPLHTMIKNIILQTVALYGYDYVKIVLFLGENSKAFDFSRILPHFWDESQKIRYIGCNDNEIKEISIVLERIFDSTSPIVKGKSEVSPPYYLIINLEPNLCLSVGILKKILEAKENRGFSLIVAGNELRVLPKECSRVICLENGESESYVLEKENLREKLLSFTIEEQKKYTYEDVAEILANTFLETGGVSAAIPSKVEFLELYGVKKVEHLNVLERWKNNDPTLTLEAPVGLNAYGNTFMLDLHQNIHGPHGLVAGMTGSGKSEFIITYILSMAINYHPNDVAFVLIDYKGGGMAKTFKDLPHTVGIITNLDGAGIKRSLVSIRSELSKRQEIFLELSSKIGESNIDIYKYQKLYRSGIVEEPLPHLFIISDEFAELKQQRPEFMEQLISIARIGRSLGVHLILATQKPAGVVNEQIWSNSKFKVCLKVQTKEDSQSMLNRPDAANLVQTGRFYLQVGYNELFEIGQSAWAGAPYTSDSMTEAKHAQLISVIDNIGRVISTRELTPEEKESNPRIKKQVDVITAYLMDIANLEGIKSRKLWKDEMPGEIAYHDLSKKYSFHSYRYEINPLIGEIDDPENQSQTMMTLPITREGNAIILGNVGSGKSMLLDTFLYSIITEHSPEDVSIYIMDFDAETMTAFNEAPHVGGVVLIDDVEKIDKLLQMLSSEMFERKKRYIDFGGDYDSYNRANENKDKSIILVINNITAFEESYEPKLNNLIRIARNGAKYGIYTVATRIGAFGIRYKLLSCFPQKLMLQCSDETEYSSIFGKTDGMIPSDHIGRGLIKTNGALLEFQAAKIILEGSTVDFIIETCDALLSSNPNFKAKEIPVLPEKLYSKDLLGKCTIQDDDLKIPIGLYEKSVSPCIYDFSKQFISFILSNAGIHQEFSNHILQTIIDYKKYTTFIFDSDYALSAFSHLFNYASTGEKSDELVIKLFNETLRRDNEYITALENGETPPIFATLVVIIDSLSALYSKLSEDGVYKLNNILYYGDKKYRMHIIILDRIDKLNGYFGDKWYKKHISEREAIWIGNNLSRQLRIQCAAISKDAIPDDFAYVISNGRLDLIKIPYHKEVKSDG